MISDARTYLEMARQIGEAGQLERQLLWLEAMIAKSAKDWDKVRQILERYVEEFKVAGAHYEDPYVCEELAWARIQQARRTTPKGNLPLDPSVYAKKYYDIALSLLHSAVTRSKTVDPQLRNDYWRIVSRLMQVNAYVGRNEVLDGYLDIHKFINESQQRIRKEAPDKWPQLKKLWLEALEKLKKNPAEFIKPDDEALGK
jgi:hypothetical protein